MRTRPAAERRKKVAPGASPGSTRPRTRAPKGRKKSVRRNTSPFSLTISTAAGATYAPFLRQYLRRARALIRSPLRDLHIVLLGNARMSRLHDQFMNVPTPTDVLTFPIDLDARGRPLSGEVYLCIPYARARARQLNVPLQHELLLYALHGMLHLSGYDDRTQRDYQTMHAREDQILRKIGIGKVFARAGVR